MICFDKIIELFCVTDEFCCNRRINRSNVFKHFADIGKSIIGWFYGFKLHIIIDDRGVLLSFCVTQANGDDRLPLKYEPFLKFFFGMLCADKGFIFEKLHKLLFVDGIGFVASIRSNMKNSLMLMSDQILLRKRFVIETVDYELKMSARLNT